MHNLTQITRITNNKPLREPYGVKSDSCPSIFLPRFLNDAKIDHAMNLLLISHSSTIVSRNNWQIFSGPIYNTYLRTIQMISFSSSRVEFAVCIGAFVHLESLLG